MFVIMTKMLWKQIPDFPSYSVSCEADVRDDVGHGNNTYEGKHLLWTLNKETGYLQVGLYRYGKLTTKALHVLVAKAFIPNPMHLPVVHHKDFNRANPRADNLVWVTYAENNRLTREHEKLLKARSH